MIPVRRGQHGRKNLDHHLQVLRSYLTQPRTMDSIVGYFGCSRGTVYRWLDLLAERGLDVRRVGMGRPTKYLIR